MKRSNVHYKIEREIAIVMSVITVAVLCFIPQFSDWLLPKPFFFKLLLGMLHYLTWRIVASRVVAFLRNRKIKDYRMHPDLTHLTGAQFQILHQITRWKYKPTAEDLITLKQYNELPDFIKGYAHYLQISWPESEIPKDKIKSKGFEDGEHWATMETQESVS